MGASGPSDAAPPAIHARMAVWMLFVCVLLLATLAPVVVLLRAASSPIAARVCMTPANPHLGQQAYLVVNIAKPSDQVALHGPWARIDAQWDMPAMEMGKHTVSLSGDEGSSATFDVPLTLDMSGGWKADVVVSTPGRPVWRQTVAFMVAGSPGAQNISTQHVPAVNGEAPCLL